ncbi:MAG TPA: lysylphosphatidylglycerol synthase domain-containing protein [Vicinamibacterales bacterium]
MRNGTRARAGLLAALLGLALFGWALSEAGLGAVVGGLERVGAGFILVVLISAVRPLVRATAWRLCLDDRSTLTLPQALSASITGTALGDLTPFGLLLSEPAKAMLVRGRIGFVASFSALTIENLLYTASVVIVVLGGTAAFLLSFPVPPPVQAASLLLVSMAVATAIAMAFVLLRRAHLASTAVARCGAMGRLGRLAAERAPHVRAIEEQIVAFAAHHRGRLLPLALLEATFHASAIAEVWVTLSLLGVHPTMLGAFVLEYVDRVITITFKFVPLRLGVDEAGTGLAASILGLGSAPGVALAIVRKGRVLVWTAIGVLLLARRGLSVREAIERSAVSE